MLRSMGRKPEAADHLRKAAASPDSNIRNAALRALSNYNESERSPTT
jgi:hypothetical protein